jgi:hypothetical protein
MLHRDVPGTLSRDVVTSLKSLDREEFWEEGHRSDGLAIFAAPGFLAAYRLPAQFPELQVVGATFHTKPLIRFLQSNSLAYYLLAINIQRVVLYEGLGESIHEVPLRGVPGSLEEMEREPEEFERSVRQAGGARIHYAQGGPKEQMKTDHEKFFRVVAKEVWKKSLHASTKPLILAAPSQHQPIFRKVAQIPTLLEQGIQVDPAKMTPEELHVEARRVLEPEIRRRIERAKDEFGLARSRGHGSDNLQDIARCVVASRVKLLFVESGRRIWGMLDTQAGEILPGEPSRNAYDVDLLDELAELTLFRGGEVYVLKKEEMPTAQGIAAIFRF